MMIIWEEQWPKYDNQVYFSIEFGKSSMYYMYWRYLSKKHFIGIVECFSKFFILHRERSLLYKLFWCFCPRKIALLRNWCQIRFLLSLYKSLNTILRNVFIDAMVKELYLEIFFKKVIFTKFYGKVAGVSTCWLTFSNSMEKTSHSILPQKVELWLF